VTSDADIELIVRIVLRVLQEVRQDGPRPDRFTSRTLITERDVVAAIPAGRLEMARGAVVTPLARDTAQEKGVELVEVG
jgi:hypothetical protein